ncbi:MAG: ankyrin repeat domain-containing protein [Desulfarculus sp.]|nr:ankyrin repeat domain-containing protein [Desulfarculus sp.]
MARRHQRLSAALGAFLLLAALTAGCGPSPDPPPPPGLVDSSLEMALWKAAQACDPPTLRNLLSAGAQVNTWKGPAKTTPLMEAVRTYGEACPRQNVEILLAAGALPNARDLLGNTALHYLQRTECIGIYQEMVVLLLASGADPTIHNKDCQTPMMVATKQGCQEKVAILAEALRARNAQGLTPSPKPEECLKKEREEREKRKALGLPPVDEVQPGEFPPAEPPAPGQPQAAPPASPPGQ